MPKFSAYMKGGDGIVGPPGASFISGIVATTSQLPEYPPENRQVYLVGESDPKHIYAYVDGVWTDQGLTASEIARANASIESIGWTEDPTVQVSFSTENQKDYFNFDFAVPKTRPAGFGTSSDASATTIAFGATPTISVSASGEDWEKNFHFDFNIPAGEPAGFGTITAQTEQIAYNVNPSVEITTITTSPERAKEFNFKFNIPEAYPGKVAIDSLTTKVESISTNLNSVSTKVESISTNLNSVSTDLSNNYLKLSGGTLTGAVALDGSNLTIKQSKMLYLESSTTAGLQQARMYLRPKDMSNGNNLSFWYSNYNSHGNQLYQLPAYDESLANGNYYYQILTSKTPVTITQGGTGATSKTTAIANLFNDNIGTEANHFLTITNNYDRVGYTSFATLKSSLGLTISTATWTRNTTNCSQGVIQCIKYGNVVSLCQTTNLQLTNDLTTGSVSVGTIPEGYRPSTNQLFLYGTTTVIGFGYITTGGQITLYKPAYSNVNAGINVYVYATYILTS